MKERLNDIAEDAAMVTAIANFDRISDFTRGGSTLEELARYDAEEVAMDDLSVSRLQEKWTWLSEDGTMYGTPEASKESNFPYI